MVYSPQQNFLETTMTNGSSLTPAQKTTIEALTTRLGELGYGSHDVADDLRRSAGDFILFMRRLPNKFVVIRPTASGHLSATPSLPWGQFAPLWTELLLISRRSPVRVYLCKSELRGLKYGTKADMAKYFLGGVMPEPEARPC